VGEAWKSATGAFWLPPEKTHPHLDEYPPNTSSEYDLRFQDLWKIILDGKVTWDQRFPIMRS